MSDWSPDASKPASSESGFGLIEIVISMFLIGLVAVAFLPLIIQSMKTSVRTSSIATASQLVDQQLSAVRGLPPDCDGLQAYEAQALPEITDSRGTAFQPIREVAECPSTYPGVVRVRVSVKDAGGGDILAKAVTLVYVESKSPQTPVPTP